MYKQVTQLKTCVLPDKSIRQIYLMSEYNSDLHTHLRNTKHFPVDIQLYQHDWKLDKQEIMWKHLPRPQALGNRTRIMYYVYMTYCVAA